VTWVVFASNGVREEEARRSASRFLGAAERPGSVTVQKFRDGYLPYQGAEIKECFENLKKDVDPDLIFTHYRDDRHQDHRTVSDLTWNTWRRHLILEYEVPKYDGDLGTPNVFVPLPKSVCDRKARIICDVFQSEANKGWLSEDTFLALARLRGIECAAPERHAEAFYGRKVVLGT
jgi:LmbE family N-acetylglucosaminyl deacetylase